MTFCVFVVTFLTQVYPITSAWGRNGKVLGKRFPGLPGELERVTFPISKRFGKCPGELDSFPAISMLFSCDVCETRFRATAWPGQGLEGVPRMSLH